MVGAKKLSRFIGVENKDVFVFALVCSEPQGRVDGAWQGVVVAEVAEGRRLCAVTVDSSMGPNNWYGLELGAVALMGKVGVGKRF